MFSNQRQGLIDLKLPQCCSIFAIMLGTSFTAQAQSLENWEQCAFKVGEVIEILEIGNIGYEQEVKKQCGLRPTPRIEISQLEAKLPFDVIQAEPWKQKFQQLTGKGYDDVKLSLTVSSAMQRDGDWLVGKGHDSQGGDSSKAVIAVNSKTGKVLAIYADVTGVLEMYGFDVNSKGIPEKLWQWLSEETGAG
ncbi:hypothetical protein EC844_12949 [Acinetobacter calcoaceticus]|uniref:Secreted protein n=1 Tax=Acinetobacter calcoaceticus TaxID=471 RepID=A0A4R1XDV1_ACICA|nr:hypothetical protein EC844_12949 [Acinetobacter calcoaceticus]